MKQWIIAFLGSLVLGSGLQAQSPTPTKSPLFKFPAKVAFTVDFGLQVESKPAAAAPNEQKLLVKVDVTSTEKARRLIKIWNDGSKTEAWYIGKYQMIEHPSGKWINIINTERASSGERLNYDASDFAWISAENRGEEATYKGRPCYRFRSKAESGDSCEAVIDEQTKLPLVLVKGSTTAAYTYRQAPVGELELPPRFAEEWKKVTKR